MGYIKATEADTLHLPSNPDYTVRMKRRASYGDIEGARSAMLKIDTGPSGVISHMEWLAYIQALTTSLILDWNLTDEYDLPLPVSVENLGRLDPLDGDFLAQAAQERSKLRNEVQEIPFVNGSISS